MYEEDDDKLSKPEPEQNDDNIEWDKQTSLELCPPDYASDDEDLSDTVDPSITIVQPMSNDEKEQEAEDNRPGEVELPPSVPIDS